MSQKEFLFPVMPSSEKRSRVSDCHYTEHVNQIMYAVAFLKTGEMIPLILNITFSDFETLS